MPSPLALSPRPLADPGEAAEQARGLARSLSITTTLADILHRRGHADDEATRRFLDPKLSQITKPDGMVDREAAADRIVHAIRAHERIAVFGDYDCDGITATAILTDGLRALGGEVVPLLATRTEGAYGFSWPAYERVRATSATLLITCDCGSSDHPRVHAAVKAGVDVIVIDHHLVPKEPLPALAFLNPHRPDCGFPYKGLASCGLAMSILAAVRKTLSSALDVRRYLDLVAIGTIADVAPLSGDNRALVRAGLRVLATSPRPGLAALAELAKVGPQAFVYADEIAYRIAPRLNAPGRIGQPDDSLALLLESDDVRARALAATVEQAQNERRSVQEGMLNEALAMISDARFDEQPAIVLGAPGWHPGVVGIVAGRIASQYAKPTIVVGIEGVEGRGSVRGPSGFPLYDALVRCRHTLEGFGGHQAAAGLHVRADRLDALRDAFCEACLALDAPSFKGGEGSADVRLFEGDHAADVADDLVMLEPCGEGNRAPLLLIKGAHVSDTRVFKGHLRLDLLSAGRPIGAFGFDMGDLVETVAGQTIDITGRLRRDTYRGGDAVDLRIENVAVIGRR